MSDRAAVAEQFDDAPQQRHAAELGIWAFLATEILFFGALFLSYAVYRRLHGAVFVEAARHTDVFFGTLNTAILLTSSLSVALAAKAGRAGDARTSGRALLVTVGFALAFLVTKGFEYRGDILEGLVPGAGFRLSPPAAQIFWSFYWIATGIHALHVTIGMGVLATVYVRLRRRAFDPTSNAAIEVAAIYWHFVDIVWIFLYPMLYLMGRS